MKKEKILIACNNTEVCDLLMRFAYCCGFDAEVICDNNINGGDVAARHAEIEPELAFIAAEYKAAAEDGIGSCGKDIYFLSEIDGENVVKLPLDIAQINDIFETHGMKKDKKEVFDDLIIDEDTLTITLADKTMKLTLPEIAMLRYFVNNPDRVFSREQLAYEVFGPGISDLETLTENTVELLKNKLDGASGKWSIKLTWGVGYKFEVAR